MRTPDVQAYIDAIGATQRPLFDRFEGLIVALYPDVEVALSYKMPTYRVGGRSLHVAAWKHGLSVYGWSEGRDGGILARHPELSSGRGTLRLPIERAADVTDDELRALIRGALDPT